jgi:phosphoribosylamine---glycine ligase
MNVLIIGNGGREYSIGRALKNDKKVTSVTFAPGNGATSNIGKNITISDFSQLATYAEENQIDLTIVGPEAPLTEGIVAVFKEAGQTIFGPSKEAAQLEGSKVFMKNIFRKYSIPTADYIETDIAQEAHDFIDTMSTPIVVKADGLCGGKGVIIATSHEQAKTTVNDMLSGSSFGDAGKKVIVEEYLDGFELSVFAICDGKNFITLPAAQDHKRLLDNDEGPNTGGMGAYVPTPLVDDTLMKKIENDLIAPTMEAMISEGHPFEGVLFAGVMVVNGTPKLLEYNVRFGDPECEEIMPLIESSVFDLFHLAATNQLGSLNVTMQTNKVAIGVVAASKDYPYKSSVPAKITVTQEESENAHISYAGVTQKEDGLYATGGRVLVCVGIGNTIHEAREHAYGLMDNVHFEGKHFRKDIAYQALAQ